MQIQILSNEQQKLLPLIKAFSSDFYVVGGTAIALHIGHRRSIDFDMFTDNSFDPLKIRRKISINKNIESTLSQGEGELTVLVDKVKLTFIHYPFPIERSINFDDFFYLPDLLTLGAMKAFALGRRAKWKDYVDLYFILQKFSLGQLTAKTGQIFKKEFNEKLFRSQLGYYVDIDYSESVDFMPGYETENEVVKDFLGKISIS